MSGAEQVMDFVHKNHRIDGAAPLLFHPPGLVHYQNNCVLNISRSRPCRRRPNWTPGLKISRASGSSFIRIRK